MKLPQIISSTWNQYKYRFVPWLIFNVGPKTARQKPPETFSSSKIISELTDNLSNFEQHKLLRDNLATYSDLFVKNSERLGETAGFRLERRESGIEAAGRGVFVSWGGVRAGSVVCLYPGTIYQPYQPILLQSIRNQFIFRCVDGVFIDGRDSGISKSIFRSCAGRDQVCYFGIKEK